MDERKLPSEAELARMRMEDLEKAFTEEQREYLAPSIQRQLERIVTEKRIRPLMR